MNLPETTTDRLLAVADLIELEPERWEQSAFYFYDGERNDDTATPFDVAGREPLCGTKACIAGWSVVLNPDWGRLAGLDWAPAGAVSLGLNRELADDLFDPCLKGTPSEVADLLRHIAKLPEGKRTAIEVDAILPDDLMAVLWPENEEDDD